MTSKRMVILVCVFALIVAGVAFIAITSHNERKAEEERNATMEQEREIAHARAKAHYSLGRGRGEIWSWLEFGFDSGTGEALQRGNEFGIDSTLYLLLKQYEHETGTYLPYETVVEFFLQEFEPDGSLRLYNNGKHPEFQAYVEWVWEFHSGWRLGEQGVGQVAGRFIGSIHLLYLEYARDNESFEKIFFLDLSPQMYDALFRAYVDPDYVLDLTSLQQQGY